MPSAPHALGTILLKLHKILKDGDMWCTPIILALHRKRKIVARSRLAKKLFCFVFFETVSANTKMFLNQSTFTENSRSTI